MASDETLIGIHPFHDEITGKDGFVSEIGPHTLTILKQTYIDPSTDTPVFYAITGVFTSPDDAGTLQLDYYHEFTIDAQTMTEQDVPKVVQALATLVNVGIPPQTLCEMLIKADLDKQQAFIKDELKRHNL